MFKKLSKSSLKREEGQGLVEYALILVLVAVVVIVILSQMGPAVGNIFSSVVTVLNGGDISTLNGGDDEATGDCTMSRGGETVTVPLTLINGSVSSANGAYWEVQAGGTLLRTASNGYWATSGGGGWFPEVTHDCPDPSAP